MEEMTVREEARLIYASNRCGERRSGREAPITKSNTNPASYRCLRLPACAGAHFHMWTANRKCVINVLGEADGAGKVGERRGGGE